MYIKIYKTHKIHKRVKSFLVLLVCFSFFSGGTLKFPSSLNYKKTYEEYKVPKSIKKDLGINDIGSLNSNNSISLQKVLKNTLLHNPQLKAYAWDVKSKESLILQSKLFENPIIEAELENLGVNAFSISIGQYIELGGKRFSRIKMAKLEKKSAVWEYEIKRLNILILAGQQFLLTLKSQKKLKLLRNLIELSKKSYTIANERKNAGVATEIEILQTKKELELMRLEIEKEKNNYRLQLQTLSSYWGDHHSSLSNVAGVLKMPRDIPELSKILYDLNKSPEITGWIIQHEILQTKEKEAKLQFIPNLDLSAGYDRKNDVAENNLLLGFSLSLPIFNQNQGNIKESKINIHKSTYEKKILETKIFNNINSIFKEFKNTFEELTVLETKILPLIKNTYFEAQKFYKIGRLSSMELLNYQRDLVETETDYINLLTDFYLLKYDLELIVGTEITIKIKE